MKTSTLISNTTKFLLIFLSVTFLCDSILGFQFFSLFENRKITFYLLFLSICLYHFFQKIPFDWSFSILSIVAFIVINSFWFIWGLLNQVKFEYAFAEWRTFLTLILFILIINIQKRFNFQITERIIISICGILIFTTVSIFLVGALLSYTEVSNLDFISNIQELIHPQVYIGGMQDGFFRVLWLSSIWLVIAVFWGDLVFTKSWIKVLYFMFCALALLVTYTRGIWFGVLIGLMCSFCIDLYKKYKIRKSYLFTNNFLIFVIPMVWILAMSLNENIQNRFLGITESSSKYLISPSTSVDPSIDIRLQSINMLVGYWKQAPILGHGYGAYVPNFIRDMNVPFSYEVVPFALLMKLGVVGISLFYGFFLFVIISALRKHHHPMTSRFVGGVVAYLVTTSTNPYLFNIVGMTILGIILLQWSEIVDGNSYTSS